MYHSGTITHWNQKKGFGFIKPDKSGRDIFMHITAIKQREYVPETGQKVRYSLGKDQDGRVRAVNVFFPSIPAVQKTSVRKPKGRTKVKRNRFLITTAIVFLLAVIIASLLGYLSSLIAFLYCLMSLITFFIYRIDKQAAQLDIWRTKEATLQSLSLFGGWPGALAGQQIFKHKSKKIKFQLVFYFTVICNCAAFTWFFTELGNSIMWFVDEKVFDALSKLTQNLK